MATCPYIVIFFDDFCRIGAIRGGSGGSLQWYGRKGGKSRSNM